MIENEGPRPDKSTSPTQPSDEKLILSENTEKPAERPFPILSTVPSIIRFFEQRGLEIDKPYTKSELAGRGYALSNRVGNGERPIIEAIDGTNTSSDAFLTVKQMQQHIQESLPKGVEEGELPLIAQDMQRFLSLVQTTTFVSELLDPQKRGYAWMQNHINSFLDRLDVIHPLLDVKSITEEPDFWNWESRDEIIREAMVNIRTRYALDDRIRGIPISLFDRRGEGARVFGFPCPCFDCDYFFPASDGVKIYDDGTVTGKAGQVRMNIVTIHLASHGISNTNISLTDPDQRYMTIREYQTIYKRRAQDGTEEKILELDYKRIEKEVLMEVLKRVRNQLRIEDQISDNDLEQWVNKRLFIKD